MNLMKICVIDETVEKNIIDDLSQSYCRIKIVANPNTLSSSPITHGTLCTALLIEAIQAVEIADKIELTHLSISEKEELRSYSALLRALDYCIQNGSDIISMSVGIQSRTNLGDLFKRIEKLDHTLIVAAASNSYKLTYPASLPSVLGVRQALKNTGPLFCQRVYPPDGIDLIANLPYTATLKKLESDYGIYYGNSNSVIPPQIVAQVALAALKYNKKPSKEFALKILTEGGERYNEDEYDFPCLRYVDENEKIPIILLQHDDNFSLLEKVIDLQREFEKREYSCCVISDDISENDFVNGYYCLKVPQADDCVQYYQNVVSDSLILLYINKNICKISSIDLQIDRWEKRANADICSEILAYFS